MEYEEADKEEEEGDIASKRKRERNMKRARQSHMKRVLQMTMHRKGGRGICIL